ncbi:hypothetical protein BN14_12084 [Rhizoctonia solani AG-1 IB]|uniref:Uncharacterized protein n=1 Tax=Thanatephorus cucumeris (strain AG1-IB / isolate 7/3/14) TaxID=1108050 RepID=M5CF24_THACB|nr:hypothetical protein BN14_12084 [Rhizoctonia solani AG-1 IB]
MFESSTSTLDLPTANTTHFIGDDLFEDSIAYGQPTLDPQDIAGDEEHQSELSDCHLSLDSDEEGSGFFQAPYTECRTQPNPLPNEWFPYSSFAMYLADLLFSSRRLHFSREQMRAILEFARATGGQNIPSFSGLQKTQEKLKARVGDPTHRHVSPSGTTFHLNEILETLKQDMANPHLRPHMNFLPHVEGKHMSQAWHGYKMVHDIKDDVLTPCLRVGGQMYYVNELVRRKNDYFIPLRWITYGRSKEQYAMGYKATLSELGLMVHSDKRLTAKVSTFLESFPQMQQQGTVPMFSGMFKLFDGN